MTGALELLPASDSTSLAAFIIEFCNEKPRTIDQIRSALQTQHSPMMNNDVITPLKDVVKFSCKKKRLLHEEKERYVTLALPVNPHL